MAGDFLEAHLNSKACFDVAIEAMREKLESFRCERIGPHRLFLGDCRQILPLIGQVDAVIMDPPYENHMHAAKRWIKVFGAQRRIRTDGHANPPPLEFGSIDGLREETAALCVRVTRRWLLAFCTPEGVAPWRDALEDAGAKYKRACIWVKPDSAPQFNGQGPAMGAEMFVSAWCGAGHSCWNGGGRRNVFTHPCQPSDRTGLHPTEKPLSLMSELVALFSDPGNTVCDPFMGVGSTGVSCVRLGRRFIGIELDAGYFNSACSRIRDAFARPDLFIAQPPASPVQTSLFAETAA